MVRLYRGFRVNVPSSNLGSLEHKIHPNSLDVCCCFFWEKYDVHCYVALLERRLVAGALAFACSTCLGFHHI